MVAIGALSLAVTFGVKGYGQNNHRSLVSLNVEALTEDEGSEFKTCFFNYMYIQGQYHYKCHENTGSDGAIYPCSTMEEGYGYTEGQCYN